LPVLTMAGQPRYLSVSIVVNGSTDENTDGLKRPLPGLEFMQRRVIVGDTDGNSGEIRSILHHRALNAGVYLIEKF